jgi:ubiquinone/menaquinone biosynthesis C-methylase UbiE
MDEKLVKDCWEKNADNWTKLSRAGYDVYRDFMNTPHFLKILPDVKGKLGIDIGCGEGTNTRRVADLGATMKAIDISETFIGHARETEARDPKGIEFAAAPAQSIPFPDSTFDFATAFMSMMDMADLESAFKEVFRILKPGGFFQFSICHPCYDLPMRKKVTDENGEEIGYQVGGYFDGTVTMWEWCFSNAPIEAKAGMEKFQIPAKHRTLSQWFNMIIDTGFAIEKINEPYATDEEIAACPAVRDTRILGYFLHVRVRKPA